tara:strand:+ start:313 stop:1110 length:798 start_codon:yes stop_codon:yes gene_type:complete
MGTLLTGTPGPLDNAFIVNNGQTVRVSNAVTITDLNITGASTLQIDGSLTSTGFFTQDNVGSVVTGTGNLQARHFTFHSGTHRGSGMTIATDMLKLVGADSKNIEDFREVRCEGSGEWSSGILVVLHTTSRFHIAAGGIFLFTSPNSLESNGKLEGNGKLVVEGALEIDHETGEAILIKTDVHVLGGTGHVHVRDYATLHFYEGSVVVDGKMDSATMESVIRMQGFTYFNSGSFFEVWLSRQMIVFLLYPLLKFFLFVRAACRTH